MSRLEIFRFCEDVIRHKAFVTYDYRNFEHGATDRFYRLCKSSDSCRNQRLNDGIYKIQQLYQAGFWLYRQGVYYEYRRNQEANPGYGDGKLRFTVDQLQAGEHDKWKQREFLNVLLRGLRQGRLLEPLTPLPTEGFWERGGAPGQAVPLLGSEERIMDLNWSLSKMVVCIEG